MLQLFPPCFRMSPKCLLKQIKSFRCSMALRCTLASDLSFSLQRLYQKNQSETRMTLRPVGTIKGSCISQLTN